MALRAPVRVSRGGRLQVNTLQVGQGREPSQHVAELVELLAATVGASSSLHPAWGAELRRRVAEIESGKVQPIPWDEVRREARARLDAGGSANG